MKPLQREAVGPGSQLCPAWCPLSWGSGATVCTADTCWPLREYVTLCKALAWAGTRMPSCLLSPAEGVWNTRQFIHEGRTGVKRRKYKKRKNIPAYKLQVSDSISPLPECQVLFHFLSYLNSAPDSRCGSSGTLPGVLIP